MSAYDDVEKALAKQKFYVDSSGSRLYDFQRISCPSVFGFVCITLDGQISVEFLEMAGLRCLFPVHKMERKRVLKKFGLEEEAQKGAA